jgi:hypothetical protein
MYKATAPASGRQSAARQRWAVNPQHASVGPSIQSAAGAPRRPRRSLEAWDHVPRAGLQVQTEEPESRKSRSGSSDSRNHALRNLTLTCLTLTGAAPPFEDEPPAAEAGVRAARPSGHAGARAPGLRVGGGRPSCARAPTSPPTAGALKARPSSRESLKHGSPTLTPTLEIRVVCGQICAAGP